MNDARFQYLKRLLTSADPVSTSARADLPVDEWAKLAREFRNEHLARDGALARADEPAARRLCRL